MAETHHAKLRLIEKTDDYAVLAIPGSNYRLRLQADGLDDVEVGDRVRGEVRVKVWKLESVAPGGSFIAPVHGRPRRVQGVVRGALDGNRLIVEVAGCPFVADLPERWQAGKFAPGSRVGLDLIESRFTADRPTAASV